MKSFTSVALIGAAAAKWHLGRCPEVQYIEDFDPIAYTGKWYEVYRDKNMCHTKYADCVTKEFNTNENGNTDLYFRGFYNWHGWGRYFGVNGELSECETGSSDTYTCLASMGHHGKHKYTKRPINVLATDYENYDIYYECHDFFGFFNMDNLSISSRNTHKMSEDKIDEVVEVVKHKLPHYNLKKDMYFTKQGEDKCDYYWLSENNGKMPSNHW